MCPPWSSQRECGRTRCDATGFISPLLQSAGSNEEKGKKGKKGRGKEEFSRKEKAAQKPRPQGGVAKKPEFREGEEESRAGEQDDKVQHGSNGIKTAFLLTQSHFIQQESEENGVAPCSECLTPACGRR